MLCPPHERVGAAVVRHRYCSRRGSVLLVGNISPGERCTKTLRPRVARVGRVPLALATKRASPRGAR